MPDWRDGVFAARSPLEGSAAVHTCVASVGRHPVIAALWDFSAQGGSFGADDATAFVAAVEEAGRRKLPLVSVLRSGGTRLTEGMHALVGIPRAVLALERLRRIGVPHLAVADQPTTGGVWVGIGSGADVRIGVADAVVAFSGPRVVSAMTGRAVTTGEGTARSAYDAGLLDVLAEPHQIGATLAAALAALAPDTPEPVPVPPPEESAEVDGWEQVVGSRRGGRPGGAALLGMLLPDAVELRSPDRAVVAALGRLHGRRMVGVALAAERSGMPTPAGYDLLERCAQLAGDLGVGLLVLVDTPGADPHTESAGLAARMRRAMAAVLDCAAPTVSLVHGEGGSGGALAGAVTDRVGVTENGWFAPLAPEGAAAALRCEPADIARRMRLTPRDLLQAGFADQQVPIGQEAGWVAAVIDELRDEDPERRRAARRLRWSSPLPDSSRKSDR